jgi:hypothetical protein
MYIPVTASGFAVFGHDVNSNILESLTPGPVVTAALILVTAHLITTVILMTNPATQHLEILFKVPPRKSQQYTTRSHFIQKEYDFYVFKYIMHFITV